MNLTKLRASDRYRERKRRKMISAATDKQLDLLYRTGNYTERLEATNELQRRGRSRKRLRSHSWPILGHYWAGTNP